MSNHITNDLQNLQTEISENEFKEKNVLVTGAAGFLGSWITDHLILAKTKVLPLT